MNPTEIFKDFFFNFLSTQNTFENFLTLINKFKKATEGYSDGPFLFAPTYFDKPKLQAKYGLKLEFLKKIISKNDEGNYNLLSLSEITEQELLKKYNEVFNPSSTMPAPVKPVSRPSVEPVSRPSVEPVSRPPVAHPSVREMGEINSLRFETLRLIDVIEKILLPTTLGKKHNEGDILNEITTKKKLIEINSDINNPNLTLFNMRGIFEEIVDIKRKLFARIFEAYGKETLDSIIYENKLMGGSKKTSKKCSKKNSLKGGAKKRSSKKTSKKRSKKTLKK